MEPFDPDPSETPPADAEEWTDEQWLSWLKATDAESGSESEGTPATKSGRLIRTHGAAMLGQTMMGLYRVIYGQRNDEVVIIAEANSEPEDESFALHLDPDDPERSYVVIRPDTQPPEDSVQ